MANLPGADGFPSPVLRSRSPTVFADVAPLPVPEPKHSHHFAAETALLGIPSLNLVQRAKKVTGSNP